VPVISRNPTPDPRTSALQPEPVNAPILQVKKAWSDNWQYRSELELVAGRAAAAGQDLGSLQFRRVYGRVKAPHESDITTRTPIDLQNWWVRLLLVTDQGPFTVWVGRVTSEVRGPHGGDVKDGSDNAVWSGVQTWTAYEPLQLLRKIHISESKWWQDSAMQTLGWVPGMNARDARKLLVGNRSESHINAAGTAVDASDSEGSYLYGGSEQWTRFQYLQYILHRFVEDRDSDGDLVGPAWMLSGYTDTLHELTDTVDFGVTQTAADIIRKLISTRHGIDYKIVPLVYAAGSPPDVWGFDIQVYPLLAQDVTFGGTTLPKNPDLVNLKRSEHANMLEPRIERSADHQYKRIRVLGKRIVVCCSLHGDKAIAPGFDRDDEERVVTLVAKWSAALETAYKAGTGNSADASKKHDAARAHDRFTAVYQQFGAPTDWDFHAGFANPILYSDGQTIEVEDVSTGAYQNQVRETLSWLPLLAGYDYGPAVPVIDNTSDHEPGQLPPVAWILDPKSEQWATTDAVGLGAVQRLTTDWGLRLNPAPNHLLAKNHWTSANGSKSSPTHDYDTLVFTIAFESDHRVTMEYQVADTVSPEDGILDIQTDAEFWYLAPNTAVGVRNTVNETQTTNELVGSGSTGRVLRNDVTRMAAVMAGAIARYFNERARATITFRGLLPWAGLLGQILNVVEGSGGDTQSVQAPITGVEWHPGPPPMTIIHTGFAR